MCGLCQMKARHSPGEVWYCVWRTAAVLLYTVATCCAMPNYMSAPSDSGIGNQSGRQDGMISGE